MHKIETLVQSNKKTRINRKKPKFRTNWSFLHFYFNMLVYLYYVFVSILFVRLLSCFETKTDKNQSNFWVSVRRTCKTNGLWFQSPLCFISLSLTLPLSLSVSTSTDDWLVRHHSPQGCQSMGTTKPNFTSPAIVFGRIEPWKKILENFFRLPCHDFFFYHRNFSLKAGEVKLKR